MYLLKLLQAILCACQKRNYFKAFILAKHETLALL